MTIKFICSCGKHLKAEDEMAARRSICPRCGAPVGIPSLQPTHSGTAAAPLTPRERRRLARSRDRSGEDVLGLSADALTAQAPQPPKAEAVLLRSEPPPEEGHRSPPSLAHSFRYALRASGFCISVGLGMTLATAGFAWLVPRVAIVCMADPLGEMFLGGIFRFLALLPLLLLLGGIPCSFLDHALGSWKPLSVGLWEGGMVSSALRSGLKWLAAFLAGPFVFAVPGYLFWLNWGDPTLLDRLILAELSVVCVLWWLYTLIALADRGGLRNLDPLVVSDVAYRMGRRGFVLTFAASTVLLAHAYGLYDALERIQAENGWGWLLLAGMHVSGLFWGTFFCRALGLWSRFTRTLSSSPASPPAVPPQPG
jgi:hypothetical protein